MGKKKKLVLIIVLLTSILAVVILLNTMLITDNQVKNVPAAAKISVDQDQAALRLSEALKFRTVSFREPEQFDYNQFEELYSYLKIAFPSVYKQLKIEKVNNYSLLYTWEGSESLLKPVILAAHIDVVDIEKETLNSWRHAPFSGDISEGKVWGRGARDNKSQVLAILEAVEYLIEQGITPKRTIILAFGHDEEVLGINGAKKISELLQSRNIVPECVIDEGGTVVEKAIPGLNGKTAIIATSEKGYLTLELSVNGRSGHSSEPEKQTSIGILCQSISKLQDNPFPTTLNYVEPMLSYAAFDMNFPYNIAFSNLWLTGGVVEKILLRDSASAAMLRTTIAPTIINGGYQDNVLPATAKAIINLRLLPGDTVDNTIKKISEIIDDPSIQINMVGFSNNAPPPSPTESLNFKTISKTIRQVFPGVTCVPGLTTGGTDAKHYSALTPNLYRFTPSFKEKDEEGHGINERIQIENYIQYIVFYVNLISNFQ